MTLTIEVDEEKVLDELKEFLEKKKEIRVVHENSQEPNVMEQVSVVETKMTDEERKAIIRSLWGSVNMGPERIKEFEAYVQRTRDELE